MANRPNKSPDFSITGTLRGIPEGGSFRFEIGRHITNVEALRSMTSNKEFRGQFVVRKSGKAYAIATRIRTTNQ